MQNTKGGEMAAGEKNKMKIKDRKIKRGRKKEEKIRVKGLKTKSPPAATLYVGERNESYMFFGERG